MRLSDRLMRPLLAVFVISLTATSTLVIYFRFADHVAMFESNRTRVAPFLAVVSLVEIACILFLSVRSVRAVVIDFFTARDHPINLAVFRITFFVTFLIFVIKNWQNVVFFSSLPASLRFPPVPFRLVSFTVVPISTLAARVTLVLLVLFCVLAIVGLFSRVSAIVVALLGFYVLGIPEFYGKVNHYHQFVWFALVLAFSRCGDALSIDAILAARRRAERGSFYHPEPDVAYALPLRFIWLLIGIIYFFPGFWKLWSLGSDSAFSSNMKYIMLWKWTELGGWTPFFRIDHHPQLLHVAALGTIMFELSFIVLILFRRTRWLAVLGGLFFHNLTNLFMRISFIELQICYVAFVNWHSAFERIRRALFKERTYFVYDGSCTGCRKTVSTLQVLDMLGAITFVDGLDRSAREAHHLAGLPQADLLNDATVVDGGKIYRGFAGYRRVFLRIPACWPLVPMLYVRPIATLGERIYERMAHSRSCGIVEWPDARTTGGRFRNPISVPAASVLGAAVLAINSVAGAAGTVDAWPFACYPTFAGRYTNQEDSLQLTAITSTGDQISSVDSELSDKFSSERWAGLVSHIVGDGDRQSQQVRLIALAGVAAREDPRLPHLSELRVYRVTLQLTSADPIPTAIDTQLLASVTISPP